MFAIAVVAGFHGVTACAAESNPATALGMSCSACHRQTAASTPAIPELSRLSLPDIASALRAYRSGDRKGTVMPRIARALSDAEIDQIARETAGR